MKPKLTISVRRGLTTIAALAGADVDADRSMECPQFTGQRMRDIDRALHWVACLDERKAPPPITAADIAKHDEAIAIAREHRFEAHFGDAELAKHIAAMRP
jgi:hypothetical protein